MGDVTQFGWFVMIGAVLAGTNTSALADDDAEGARLFEEGRALAKAGNYDEACDRFGRSFELERAPGVALNYGDCLEHLGQLRKAWELFDEAARVFGEASDTRAAFARSRADAVEAKLVVVTVELADPELAGLSLSIARTDVPASARVEVRRDPGEIVVEATAPRHQPFVRTERGEPGQHLTIKIPALSPVNAEAPVPVTGAPVTGAPVTGARGERSPGRVKLALGVTGAGALILAGGGVLGLVAHGQYNSAVDDECMESGAVLVCNPRGVERVDAAATKARIGMGLAIGGGALVAAGVVLFFTAPKERALVPTASASSVGFLYTVRY